MSARAGLYAGIGPVLVQYDVDVETCTVMERSRLALPDDVEYGCAHPRRAVLYVSCGAPGRSGAVACAVALDPSSGAPSLLGPPARLPHRAVHVTTDHPGEHLLLAHHRAAAVSVVRIGPDGTLGERVEQRADLDPGVFPHQVRLTPDNRHCISVARGNPPSCEGQLQNDPGSLNVFAYRDGVLGEQTTVTVGDGYRFGPRNLDFHPAGPWVYLALETQNEIVVLERGVRGLISSIPLQRLSTLAHPRTPVHQGVGPILIHPRGHVVYVANRGYQAGLALAGKKTIPATAENSVVAYATDARTGLLTELQRIDSGGTCPRTLSLDPTGRMLVVANSETYWVGNELVPKNLSTFRVLDDGCLEFAHRYEVDPCSDADIGWAGIVAYR